MAVSYQNNRGRFLVFESNSLRLNGDIFPAERISLSLNTALAESVGNDGRLIGYAPTSFIKGNVDLDFYLTGELPDYLTAEGATEVPVKISFNTVFIYGYLESIDYTIRPFEPIGMKARFVFFHGIKHLQTILPDTIDGKLTEGSLKIYDSAGVKLGYGAQIASYFTNFNYSLRIKRTPYGKIGSTVPTRVAIEDIKAEMSLEGSNIDKILDYRGNDAHFEVTFRYLNSSSDREGELVGLTFLGKIVDQNYSIGAGEFGKGAIKAIQTIETIRRFPTIPPYDTPLQLTDTPDPEVDQPDEERIRRDPGEPYPPPGWDYGGWNPSPGGGGGGDGGGGGGGCDDCGGGSQNGSSQMNCLDFPDHPDCQGQVSQKDPNDLEDDEIKYKNFYVRNNISSQIDCADGSIAIELENWGEDSEVRVAGYLGVMNDDGEFVPVIDQANGDIMYLIRPENSEKRDWKLPKSDNYTYMGKIGVRESAQNVSVSDVGSKHYKDEDCNITIPEQCNNTTTTRWQVFAYSEEEGSFQRDVKQVSERALIAFAKFKNHECECGEATSSQVPQEELTFCQAFVSVGEFNALDFEELTIVSTFADNNETLTQTQAENAPAYNIFVDWEVISDLENKCGYDTSNPQSI